jgi:hypothetical protein
VACNQYVTTVVAAHKLGYPILIEEGRIVTFDSGDIMIYLRRDEGKSQWGLHCKFENTFTIVTMVKDVINDNGDYSWMPNGKKCSGLTIFFLPKFVVFLMT